MERVLIESPYAGLTTFVRERNHTYLRAALLDCLERGEAPFASHALYPQVLKDAGYERALGIAAGLAWAEEAHRTVAYLDLGMSPGMELGIAHARKLGRPVEYRRFLSKIWDRIDGTDPEILTLYRDSVGFFAHQYAYANRTQDQALEDATRMFESNEGRWEAKSKRKAEPF